jgi:hypothetical protein
MRMKVLVAGGLGYIGFGKVGEVPRRLPKDSGVTRPYRAGAVP